MIKSVDPCLLSSLVIAVVITLICGLGQTSFLSELPTQMAPWDFAARGSQKTTNETTSKERLRKTPICFCVVKTECSVCVVNVMCPPVRWHFPSKLVGAQHLQHLPVWRHGITASSRKPTGKCWKCIRKTLETSGGDTRQSLYTISSLPPRKGESQEVWNSLPEVTPVSHASPKFASVAGPGPSEKSQKNHPPKHFSKSSTTSHLKDSRQSPAALRDPFRDDWFTDSPIQSPNPRSSRSFATFNLYTRI